MLMEEDVKFFALTSGCFVSSRRSNHKVVIVVSSHNRLLIDKHVSALLGRVVVWKLSADKNAGSRFKGCMCARNYRTKKT